MAMVRHQGVSFKGARCVFPKRANDPTVVPCFGPNKLLKKGYMWYLNNITIVDFERQLKRYTNTFTFLKSTFYLLFTIPLTFHFSEKVKSTIFLFSLQWCFPKQNGNFQITTLQISLKWCFLAKW
jgi:hypothetical protein